MLLVSTNQKIKWSAIGAITYQVIHFTLVIITGKTIDEIVAAIKMML